jgi:hypothetical protein
MSCFTSNLPTFPVAPMTMTFMIFSPVVFLLIYFGPTAPPGHEAYWVQTIPGKGWNVLLRLYGPLQPWYDKTWRFGE